jgi:hypothetical protein
MLENKIETFTCPYGMSESLCQVSNHALAFLNANSLCMFKPNFRACLKSLFESVVLMLFMSLCI